MNSTVIGRGIGEVTEWQKEDNSNNADFDGNLRFGDSPKSSLFPVPIYRT
jgi:hypothetical protein